MNWRRPYIPPGPWAATLHAICDGIQMCQINYAPGGIVTRTSRGTTIRPIGQPTGLAGGAVLEATISETHDDYYVGTLEDGSTVNIAKPHNLRASNYRPGWTIGSKVGMGTVLNAGDGAQQLAQGYSYAIKLITAQARWRLVRPLQAFPGLVEGPANIRALFDSWRTLVQTQTAHVNDTDGNSVTVGKAELADGSDATKIDYAVIQEIVYPFFPLSMQNHGYPEGLNGAVLDEQPVYCLPLARTVDVWSDAFQRATGFPDGDPTDALVACTHIDLNTDNRQWVDANLVTGQTVLQYQYQVNQLFGSSSPAWYHEPY